MSLQFLYQNTPIYSEVEPAVSSTAVIARDSVVLAARSRTTAWGGWGTHFQQTVWQATSIPGLTERREPGAQQLHRAETTAHPRASSMPHAKDTRCSAAQPHLMSPWPWS